MKLEWNPPSIPKKIVAGFEWRESYAIEVHEGAHYLGGARGLARPWTEVAISSLDLPALIKSAYVDGDLRSAFLVMVYRLIEEFEVTIDTYNWNISSTGTKQYRPGVPTWSTITDSGALRDSLEVTINES